MSQMQSFEQFEEQYKPVLNHIALQAHKGSEPQDCAPVCGYMYETFGTEASFISSQEKQKIWTIVEMKGADEEEGEPESGLVIQKGYHVVNRIGYIITENPWTEESQDAQI